MKKTLLFAAVLILAGIAAPQTKDASIPLKDSTIGLKIRNSQLDESNLRVEYEKLQAQYAADQKTIADATTEAFKSQGLSEDQYSFDANSLTFTQKPTAAPKK